MLLFFLMRTHAVNKLVVANQDFVIVLLQSCNNALSNKISLDTLHCMLDGMLEKAKDLC